MKIGELAERAGLTTSRIRFYERIGLLKLVSRQENGYRSYPDEAVMMLKLIVSGQRVGFSLDELRTLLPSDFTNWKHGPLLNSLRHKVQDIDHLQAQLAQNKAHLVDIITKIEAKPLGIDCTTNAQRILSEINFVGAGTSLAEEI
ncbi:MerR family transcriptional regulator [Pseudomonas putida]|uniref:MerR family transcriptional regulator n=1 Tax=Pseudomonas putida TaxID=303 RepID=UPI0018AB57C2|nr:MerR family transcriptional regulator [Pseudomonas putida]MBF8668254.1 MerR family transcriptional regulator [Pseudomonas putida]MBF8711754.1 MerR family transcriptional regulator [Pseudomonas putida]